MSSVNHGFGGGLVQNFQRNERMWKRENCMKSVEKKEGRFLQVGRSYVPIFLLVKICGVGLEFHNNQLGTEILLDFFFF
jgi:hypothetical protein